jgi:hypothetical protein
LSGDGTFSGLSGGVNSARSQAKLSRRQRQCSPNASNPTAFPASSMALNGNASGATCRPEAAASAAASRAWSKAGLADARRRVDQHEPLAGRSPHPVPETGSAVDPLRLDLVADDEVARAGGSAEELLRGLIVLSAGHSLSFGVGSWAW